MSELRNPEWLGQMRKRHQQPMGVWQQPSLLASHHGDPGSNPGWVTPDFRMRKSCRTMSLVGGFSRGSPVFPAPSFPLCSIFSAIIILIGSQDLDVKSRPNLFTRPFMKITLKTMRQVESCGVITLKTMRQVESCGVITLKTMRQVESCGVITLKTMRQVESCGVITLKTMRQVESCGVITLKTMSQVESCGVITLKTMRQVESCGVITLKTMRQVESCGLITLKTMRQVESCGVITLKTMRQVESCGVITLKTMRQVESCGVITKRTCVLVYARLYGDLQEACCRGGVGAMLRHHVESGWESLAWCVHASTHTTEFVARGSAVPLQEALLVLSESRAELKSIAGQIEFQERVFVGVLLRLARSPDGKGNKMFQRNRSQKFISGWREERVFGDVLGFRSSGEPRGCGDLDSYQRRQQAPTDECRASTSQQRLRNVLLAFRGPSNAFFLLESRWNARAGGNRIAPRRPGLPAASSGTIPTCENPGVAPPGVEPGSPWCELSRLDFLLTEIRSEEELETYATFVWWLQIQTCITQDSNTELLVLKFHIEILIAKLPAFFPCVQETNFRRSVERGGPEDIETTGQTTRLGRPGSTSGGVAPRFPHVEIMPDDSAGRRVLSGISRFPPPLYSGAAPYSARFTLIGSQDIDVKSRPNLFSPLHARKFGQMFLSSVCDCHIEVQPIFELGFGDGSQQAGDMSYSLSAMNPNPTLEHPKRGFERVTTHRCTMRHARTSRHAVVGAKGVRGFRKIQVIVNGLPWILEVVELGLNTLRPLGGELRGISLHTRCKASYLLRVKPEFTGGRKREISEKTRWPAASFCTIPTCENSGVTRLRIEPGSSWWEASALAARFGSKELDVKRMSNRHLNADLDSLASTSGRGKRTAIQLKVPCNRNFRCRFLRIEPSHPATARTSFASFHAPSSTHYPVNAHRQSCHEMSGVIRCCFFAAVLTAGCGSTARSRTATIDGFRKKTTLMFTVHVILLPPPNYCRPHRPSTIHLPSTPFICVQPSPNPRSTYEIYLQWRCCAGTRDSPSRGFRFPTFQNMLPRCHEWSGVFRENNPAGETLKNRLAMPQFMATCDTRTLLEISLLVEHRQEFPLACSSTNDVSRIAERRDVDEFRYRSLRRSVTSYRRGKTSPQSAYEYSFEAVTCKACSRNYLELQQNVPVKSIVIGHRKYRNAVRQSAPGNVVRPANKITFLIALQKIKHRAHSQNIHTVKRGSGAGEEVVLRNGRRCKWLVVGGSWREPVKRPQDTSCLVVVVDVGCEADGGEAGVRSSEAGGAPSISDVVAILVAVEVVVDGVVVRRRRAVDVVEPVADAVVLVEERAVGAEEAELLAGRETPVPHLRTHHCRYCTHSRPVYTRLAMSRDPEISQSHLRTS
ncbi:hypothetical protein PR048_028573 [Dryococelus australis]|uniref:Uncharacterized protein n=1 Tax=Dryococelus australis TaxID=614101 RepID=A0ABQ9GET6_9NEOP|nr:hypothetical protein PR048_028573 [Dryococelus australis]